MSDDLTPKSIIFSTMKAEFDKEIVVDPASFKGKVEQLKAKWYKADDSEQTRTMCTFIGLNLHKIDKAQLALLADNVIAYEKEWEVAAKTWGRHLELSCLIGSKNVGEFILSKVEDNFDEEYYNFIFDRILMSENHEWIVSFAEKMHEKNMKRPQGLFSYCNDFDLRDEICAVFERKQSSSLSNSSNSSLL